MGNSLRHVLEDCAIQKLDSLEGILRGRANGYGLDGEELQDALSTLEDLRQIVRQSSFKLVNQAVLDEVVLHQRTLGLTEPSSMSQGP